MAALAAALAPAAAADLGGNCCADLEERIAELEATTARKGNRKVKLTVSGQVNESLLFWDDGVERNTYVVTNEYSQSRFRFVGDAKIDGEWSAGYLLEIGVRGARGDRVSQSDDNGGTSANSLNIRHSAWWLGHKQLGKVWVGQTSEASDGITEVTLANTSHFATPSWGNSYGDGGAGFNLRRTNGIEVTSLQWGDFGTMGTAQGVPGEGHRWNVVKYDSPAIAGFTASASWGEDDIWSVALRYAGEFSGIKLAGGVGYTRSTDLNTTDRRGVGDTREVGLSGSVLHVESGLFATGAWGRLNDDGLDGLYGRNVDDTIDFFFVQAGVQKKFLPLGTTTLFGEYFDLTSGAGATPSGGILNAAGLGTGFNQVADSQIRGWGVGANQNLAEAIDVYVLYRHADLDVTTTNGVATAKASLEPFQFVTAGAVIKF